MIILKTWMDQLRRLVACLLGPAHECDGWPNEDVPCPRKRL